MLKSNNILLMPSSKKGFSILLIVLVVFLIVVAVGFALLKAGLLPGSLKNVVSEVNPANQKNRAANQAVFGDKPVMEIPMKIASPANGSTVSTSQVTVSGKTVSGADVAVNDKELTADESGIFSVMIDLDEGENVISVVANDQEGKEAEQDITVTYDTANSST